MNANMNENQDTALEGEIDKGERIAKALARAGVGSRRDVERMITDGRIRIDGKVLETPATLVTTLNGITVDGEPVMQAEETKVWRFHKSRGLLTTHKDPEGRPTVFQKLPNHMGRVISVGRLDMNTEGLLLLTNDGNLTRYMELPDTSLVRRYRVRVYGRVNQKSLDRLKDGVTIEGIHYGAVDAKLERSRPPKRDGKDTIKGDKEAKSLPQSSANTWLTVAITEGKNREVRRLMEHLGLTVNRLIRTHYGPFSLGSLPMGAVGAVSGKQLRDLLPDYFKDAPKTVARQETERDPSKWAKAKKSTKKKPGASRRRKPNRDQSDDRRTSDGNRKQMRNNERRDQRDGGRSSKPGNGTSKPKGRPPQRPNKKGPRR